VSRIVYHRSGCHIAVILFSDESDFWILLIGNIVAADGFGETFEDHSCRVRLVAKKRKGNAQGR
jgi:hypothetical protein